MGVAGLARPGVWRRLREWLSLEEVDVVAAADPDPERRERCARLGVPRVYGEPRELLAREPLDILHAAGNPVEQGDLVASALMRGLDILVEPPLATGARSALKLLAAARSFGGFLVPAWPAAFDPAWRGLVANALEVGRPVHLDAALTLAPEPWWGELDEELFDDPDVSLPGALALGADRLVHLALEVFGTPATVAACTETERLFGRPWDRRATLFLLYPWGTARFRIRLSFVEDGAEVRRPAGAGPVLFGEKGVLEVRRRRLALQRLSDGRRASVLPVAAGAAAQPPGWLVHALKRSVAPSGSLGLDRLAAVYRVVAALERSAAAAGSLRAVE
ncbi:hypothetical protein LIP_3209 [Limnochorda pilosa]|uniref:Gfo/Idh/MocA-like oxidoreductase N-terminal domain-containing protein n=1 Tax=Limnochorda pilosa TaxID=1555112 RepID=A0A0K2SPJ7_LIMPI|nr:hypothetical protein LIP_3209 [Limnochorda pilosa]